MQTTAAFEEEISNANYMALWALRQRKEGSSTSIHSPKGKYDGILAGDISDLLEDMVLDISRAAGYPICHEVVFEQTMRSETLIVNSFWKQQAMAKMLTVALVGVREGSEVMMLLALIRSLGRL